MWYLIAFGGGLILGVAALVWALRERSKRQEAEDRAKDAVLQLARLGDKLTEAEHTLVMVRDTAGRMTARVAVLEAEVVGLEKMLEETGDIETAKAWLGRLLKGGTL